ncbi:hypothetical protein L610_002300000380 [Aminobacter sp. J44]|nr:hypothetical protein L610_002300000380 [Aminobacter sp. J44]
MPGVRVPPIWRAGAGFGPAGGAGGTFGSGALAETLPRPFWAGPAGLECLTSAWGAAPSAPSRAKTFRPRRRFRRFRFGPLPCGALRPLRVPAESPPAWADCRPGGGAAGTIRPPTPPNAPFCGAFAPRSGSSTRFSFDAARARRTLLAHSSLTLGPEYQRPPQTPRPALRLSSTAGVSARFQVK